MKEQIRYWIDSSRADLGCVEQMKTSTAWQANFSIISNFQDPTLSTCKRSRVFNVSRTPLQCILTKDLRTWPYKIEWVHELRNTDAAQRCLEGFYRSETSYNVWWQVTSLIKLVSVLMGMQVNETADVKAPKIQSINTKDL